MLRSVRSPQMYSDVDSGCPVIFTVPNSKYTHGPPLRRHSEQLHLVATVGVDGSVRRTAPQWHEPSCMNSSEAKGRQALVLPSLVDDAAPAWTGYATRPAATCIHPKYVEPSARTACATALLA